MLYPRLVPGLLVRRDNRFRATVVVDGLERSAHVPNSGRLGELFTPGRSIWLSPATDPARKTAYDLKLVEYNSVLVSVDARLPNPLFDEALKNGTIAGFSFDQIRREVQRGDSRFDFCLTGQSEVTWVETKSVTLVEDGLACFPDAPTSRGRKHVVGLESATQAGDRAAVVFIIQRSDAQCFKPNVETDPLFTAALVKAARSGVLIRAFTCRVSLGEITISGEVPAELPL